MTHLTRLARLGIFAVTAMSATAPSSQAQSLSAEDIQRSLAFALQSCDGELSGKNVQQASLSALGAQLIDPERPSVKWKKETGKPAEFLGDSTPRAIYQPLGSTGSCTVFLFRPDKDYRTVLQLSKDMLEQNGWAPIARSKSEYAKGDLRVQLRAETKRDMFHVIRLRTMD